MNLFEPMHLVILAIVILVLFGAKKIPEFMRGIGQGVGELQKGLNDAKTKLTVDQDQATPAKQEPTPLETATKAPVQSSDSRSVQA